MELEREPRNVQVVVGEDKWIFLIDEEGIIAATEHKRYNKVQEHVSNNESQEHVSNDSQGHVGDELHHMNYEQLCHRDDVLSLRSALWEAQSKN